MTLREYITRMPCKIVIFYNGKVEEGNGDVFGERDIEYAKQQQWLDLEGDENRDVDEDWSWNGRGGSPKDDKGMALGNLYAYPDPFNED